jgi:cation diffusion facilitator CzcD-associated flavoprotein CzcO
MKNCDVAIVGSGPYGLSIAAHLRATKVDFRIFGNPMEFWLKHMPQGMHLKSEGFASSLYDPGLTFTLKTYCKERGLPYADIGSPVPLEVFAAYGLEFQKRFVPQLEPRRIVSVRSSSPGFEVTLDNGEAFTANRVVVAVGLTYFAYLPPELAALPKEYVTHSSEHGPIDKFKGREVAIVGAGASAVDLAAILHKSEASVQILSRRSKIRFQDPPENLKPSFFDHLRDPVTGIGVGWKLWACSNLPLLFRQMPDRFRMDKVSKVLGPAPCWFTKEQVVGKVGINVGVKVERATIQDGRVHLHLSGSGGEKSTMVVDRVIAATGYKYDLRSLAFLDAGLIPSIECVGTLPRLSSNFESTVPNLYFVGITAANTFGPLLRFAFGAGFTAPRIARRLSRTASSTSSVMGTAPKSESTLEHDVRRHVAQ